MYDDVAPPTEVTTDATTVATTDATTDATTEVTGPEPAAAPTNVAEAPSPPPPKTDVGAIAGLEEELGAIEAELHALDGSNTDTSG